MKTIIKSLLLLIGITSAVSAQEITRELRSFSKIVASPKINVILEKGEQESIRLVYAGIDPDQININIKGKTLRLYLDDNKITGWHKGGKNFYEGASITAYVTYTELKHLEIRGSQELVCNGPLEARKFKLKAYGENEIQLASLRTENLKASLYGENRLKIEGGKAEYQKYKLYGENKIDSRALKSYSTKTNIYGESKIKVTTQDELRINSFGESQVSYRGDAEVSRGLIFGETKITKLN